MNIESLKTEINQIIESPYCKAEFYFLLKQNNISFVRKADINDKGQIQIAQDFIKSVREKVIDNQNLSLVNLSGNDNRKNVIYYYDFGKSVEELNQLENIANSKYNDCTYFDFKADPNLKEVKGIIIILGYEQQQLALYKHHYPFTLLKQNQFLGLSLDNNRLEKIESNILRMTSNFEFFYLNNRHYIIDLKALEKLHSFHHVVKNEAFKEFHYMQSGLIENTENLRDRLQEDITFCRKFIQAVKESPVLHLPNNKVIGFIHHINQYSKQLKGIKINKNTNKIKLSTKSSQDAFLKLLKDNLLLSELTDMYYQSLAKDKLDE